MNGINITHASYWSPQWLWNNIFKQCGEWISQTTQWNTPWNTGFAEQIQKDENGYPLVLPVTLSNTTEPQIVATLMMRDLEGKYPGGTYICTYDGEGELEFQWDARIISQVPGRIVLNVAPTNTGILMRIKRSTLGNNIRNIRLVHTSMEQDTRKFDPRLVRMCRMFSIVRFMDLQETNNSPVSQSSQVHGTNHYTQCGAGGIAWKDLVDFANVTGCDPWVCIPHQATDTYVVEFATFLKNNLNADRKVWIEYSNEVWNGQFSQANWAEQKGLAMNLSTNPFQARLYFYSKRSVEVFRIFKNILGNSIVRVLASQAANSWVSDQVAGYNEAYKEADALAIAPYFGGYLGDIQHGPQTALKSVGAVIEDCRTHIRGEVKSWMTASKQVADSYKLKLVAYEGGQHLVGVGGQENNDILTSLFIATNRSPLMTDLYKEYVQQWRSMTNGEMVFYNLIDKYSKWGSWGLLENQNSLIRESPKALGIL